MQVQISKSYWGLFIIFVYFYPPVYYLIRKLGFKRREKLEENLENSNNNKSDPSLLNFELSK